MIRTGFDHAEFSRVLSGRGDGGNRTAGPRPLVVRNHVGDVHPINVIGAEDRDEIGRGLLDEIDVLMDGVGGSLVPLLPRRAHLSGNGNNELVLQDAADLPTLVEVLQQALAPELSQYVDRVNAGVDEV